MGPIKSGASLMPSGMGRPVPPHIVIEPARRKISRPRVIIRIMTIGRPASLRSAIRSMPMPTPNIVTMPSAIASQIGAPALFANASTT